MTGIAPTTGLPGLRVAREAKLLTQQRLADVSGVSRTTIIELEAGVRNAHLRTIGRLAAALGVAPQELLVTATPVRRKRPEREASGDGTSVPEQKGT
jgi:transcriptional regulator with XRE-family HTH domain